MKKYVLIVAGGKGVRMGHELPKQFIPLCGKPVLMHTLETFHNWDHNLSIIVVLPREQQSYWQMLCKELGCKVPHVVADGGETRFHSVLNGLNHIDGDGIVAVHDGVRPFVAPEVITACFEKAGEKGAAIPVVALVDSIRQLFPEGSCPVDRAEYVAVQTPQVFLLDILKSSYGQPYKTSFTDDASVVESMGYQVETVPGNRNNLKITDPLDLLIAAALLEKKENR